MTNSPRATTLLRAVLALAVVSQSLALGLAAAGVAHAQDGGLATRDAALVVDQPHYIEGDVRETSVNGTPLYVASGSPLELHPRNFQPGAVVDFGVQTPNATLTYDSRTGEFLLDAQGPGTYRVYWVVREETTSAPPGNATRGNATADARTRTVTARYTARIRVDGQTSLVHFPEGELEGARSDAANWSELLDTLQQRGLWQPGQPVEPTVQEMVNRYYATEQPLAFLSGDFTAMIIFIVTSVGAALFWVLYTGYWAIVLNRARRRLGLHEATEAEEGELMDRMSEQERRERNRNLQNMDWQDITADDFIAKAHREVHGETVYDGSAALGQALTYGMLAHDRLQVLAQNGYLARIDERDADGQPVDGEVVDADQVLGPDETPEDRDDLVELGDPSEALVYAVGDSEIVQEADITTMDFDPSACSTRLETVDLDELAGMIGEDVERFGGLQAYGKYLREFAETVREHDYTDPDGRPRELRHAMNQWLQIAQLHEDRWHTPRWEWIRQGVERALMDYDPGARAEDYVDRVRSGAEG